jgi:menaquinone-9 beta-reductase
MSGTTRKTDVFIVGGGPAGVAAGIAARQKGLSVLIADGAEPPIDKPCGEGLMPETLAALRALGVEIDRREGYCLYGIRFLHQDIRIHADFQGCEGIGIRRPLLHERMLAKAAECGVQFLWKTPVTGMSEQGVQLPLEVVEARWVIGADGSGSRVRRWSGLDAAAEKSQRYATRRHYRVRPWTEYMEIYWGENAQAYVTPIGSEEVCVVMVGERVADTSFEKAIAELPDLRRNLSRAEICSRERGAVTYMSMLRHVCTGNVALVGDASGGVDAITGDGLRLAFQHAQTLAEAMESGDLREYETAHRQLAKRPRQMGRMLLLLGRNARIRRRTMHAFAARPPLFERLLAIHQGHGSMGDFVSAGALLGWQFLAV